MSDIQGLHHVALWTGDFDRSLRFYVDGLGLKLRYQWSDAPHRCALLHCGNQGHVEIFERLEQDPDTPSEARLLHLALATEQVDAMYQKALDAGAISRMEPCDIAKDNHADPAVPLDVRIAFVLGPDGEIVEFFHDRNA